MQAAALAKLEAHDRLHKKVEKERRRIELSGEMDKIMDCLGGVVGEAGAGRGRGRGRVLSHLPAWLVKRDIQRRSWGRRKRRKTVNVMMPPAIMRRHGQSPCLISWLLVKSTMSYLLKFARSVDDMAKCSLSPSLMLIPTKSM